MNYAELVTAVQDYCENNFPTTDMDVFIRQAEQRIYNTVQIANLRKNVVGVLTPGNKYLQCPNDFLSAYSIAVYPSNTTTATGSLGAFTITVASNSGIVAGQYVTGSGIAPNATVSTVVGTTITLSKANISAVSGSVVFEGEYTYLLDKDVNFIREAYPNQSQVAKPKYYAIFGPQTSSPTELSFILGPTPDDSYYAELHYYYYPESIVTAGTTWLGDNFDSALLNGTLMEATTYMKSSAEDAALYEKRYVQSIALLKNLGDGKQRMDTYRDGQVRVKVS
jgi:hypothetical protein